MLTWRKRTGIWMHPHCLISRWPPVAGWGRTSSKRFGRGSRLCDFDRLQVDEFEEVRMKLWKRWSAVFIAAALTLATAQAQSSASHNSGSAKRPADSSQRQFANLLREPLPGHASAQAPPSFFNPDSLYQQIDGGADLYLLYDFKSLL